MGGEKTLSFNIDILGVSNEAQELEKITLQLKNLKKEKQELEKLANKGIASDDDIRKMAAYSKEIDNHTKIQKDLKKVIDSAPDSLNRMRAELINMKNAAANSSAEVRDKMSPAIKKLSEDIGKAEQAQGTWSRNVGNYAGSIGDGFLSMAKSMAGPAAAIAVLVGIFNKLKDAVMSTTFAIDTMNQIGAVTKQLFYDIAINGRINTESLGKVIEATRELNDLRVEEGFEKVKLSQINREEQAVREQSIDRTRTHAQRLEDLNKVTELESEKTKIKVGHLTKELEAKERLLKQAPANEKLMQNVLELQARINDTYAEEDQAMRRVNTQRTGFIQEEIDARKKLLDAWYKEIDDQVEKEKELFDVREKLKEQAKEIFSDQKTKNNEAISKIKEAINAEVKKHDTIKKIDTTKLKWNKDVAKQNENIVRDGEKAAETLRKESEDKKKKITDAAFAGAQMGADAVFNSKKMRLQAEMEAELSNQNLTESQKTAIKKKYAREQQKTDITQAIINGALAIGNAMATAKPFFPMAIIGAALAALTTGIQIATIKAQKYATGGRISGGLQLHHDTSRDNTLIYAKQGETVLTQPQVVALGGSGAMRRIGVPGYAEGGYIGQMSPEIPSQGFDIAALAGMINSIQVKLDVNKLNSAQNELSIINQTQKI